MRSLSSIGRAVKSTIVAVFVCNSGKSSQSMIPKKIALYFGDQIVREFYDQFEAISNAKPVFDSFGDLMDLAYKHRASSNKVIPLLKDLILNDSSSFNMRLGALYLLGYFNNIEAEQALIEITNPESFYKANDGLCNEHSANLLRASTATILGSIGSSHETLNILKRMKDDEHYYPVGIRARQAYANLSETLTEKIPNWAI